MIDLKATMDIIDAIGNDNAGTSSNLRHDAAQYVDDGNYENAQRAIEMAEFFEAIEDARLALYGALADID